MPQESGGRSGTAGCLYLLGRMLFAASPTGEKMKVLIFDETRQVLNQYLQLAPNGPHAADVLAMRKLSK